VSSDGIVHILWIFKKVKITSAFAKLMNVLSWILVSLSVRGTHIGLGFLHPTFGSRVDRHTWLMALGLAPRFPGIGYRELLFSDRLSFGLHQNKQQS
jgi:hypothetical protein